MSADAELFRRAALEAKRTPALGDIVLAQPLSFAAWSAAAIVLGGVMVGFFIWGSYTKHTTLVGRLMPNLGVIAVHPQQPGTIIEKHVGEGDAVRRGDPLFVVSSERLSSALGATRALVGVEVERRLASLEGQIHKVRELEQTERASLEEMITALGSEIGDLRAMEDGQTARLELAEQAAARYRQLREDGFVSEEQLIAKQEALLEQRSRLSQLEREHTAVARQIADLRSQLRGLPLKYENQIAELTRAIASARQERTENEAARLFIVTAPADGIATAVRGDVGQFVSGTNAVVSIVPNGSRLHAKLYAPSRAVGFINVGDDVLLRYDAYPYQKFGHHEGVVAAISRTALVPSGPGGQDGGATEPVYEITVELESHALTAYGEARPLLAGMTVEADVLQEERRLYEWVLEPLYTLTGKVH